MSLGTFLSRIFGFLRDLCIAAFFSKTETDVFFVAFRFPNFFRRLLGEGSFSASVTPALTEILHKKGKAKVKEVYLRLFTVLFCVAISLTVAGVLFMEEIMNLLFSESAYAQIEGKLEKTILAGRIVFVYLFFVSLYSYFMSVAQVFGRFFLPALAPAFFNFSLIVFALTPKSWWPFPSLSLAWAVLVGAFLQLAPVLYEMYRLEFYPKFVYSLNKPNVLKVGKRFLPGMLGLSGLSLIGLINVYFAGWLEEGAFSYIYYADRLMEFPRALIAVSVGTALIPELTRLYSVKDKSDFKKTVSYYLNFLLFLTLPCALIFFMISEPIVHLIFGRGEFKAQSIAETAMVLQFYSFVLLFSSLSRVLSSCFFAINKNWHIVFCTVLFVIFHAFLANFLTSSYGLKGLVASTALSSIFHFLLLSGFLFYLIGWLSLKSSFIMLLKILPGLFLLALCLKLYPYLHSFLPLFLALFFVLFFGGGLYILSAYLLKEKVCLGLAALFQKLLRKRNIY